MIEPTAGQIRAWLRSLFGSMPIWSERDQRMVEALRRLIENMDEKPKVTFRKTDKQVDIPQWPGDGGDNHGLLTVQSIEFDFKGEKWNVNSVTGERIIRLFNRMGMKFTDLGHEVEEEER